MVANLLCPPHVVRGQVASAGHPLRQYRRLTTISLSLRMVVMIIHKHDYQYLLSPHTLHGARLLTELD
jgi:hypothetical protein